MKRTVPSSWLAAAVGAVALLVLFQFFGNPSRGYIDTASLFYWWGFQWVNPASEGEHGWLILGLSGWLLWRNVHSDDFRLAISDGKVRQSAVGNWHSAIALLAGLALHALGYVAQQTRVCLVAFLFCLWGALRLGGGPRWGRAAVFPIAFLAFAIPLNLLDSVGFTLRVWVVEVSAAIAHAAGIAVLRSGTLLASPDGSYHYDVAAACSGVRSLTAMVALSLLLGYLNFQSWQRRAVVLLSCLPLVYLGNVARIVSIIFAAQLGGPKWGNVAHEVMGYGVFGIVLGGVLGVAALLRRWWPEPGPAVADPTAVVPPLCHPLDDKPAKPTCHLMDDKRAWAVVAGVVALAVGEMFFLRHLAQLPARGGTGVLLAADGVNPVELPAFLGTEWIGRSAAIDAVEREVLPPDTGFSRRNYAFVANRQHDIFLSIVLSGRDRSSIHRPELCLVGQGWTIGQATSHTFRFPGRADAAFEATVLPVRREVQTARGRQVVPQLVAYWFVGQDRVVSSHVQRVLLDAWNRVTRGRADRWAYVLMQTDARDGEAAAIARLQTVLEATLPAFQRPLPAARKGS